MAEQIEQIYDLKEIGGENIISILSQINAEFAQIKKTKQSLNKESIKAAFDGDTEAVTKLRTQLEQLRVKEGELKVQRQTLINQAKQQQLVRQQELAQQRALRSGNEALAGSYYDVQKRYRELSNIAKNTINLSNPGEVAEAQRELNSLKSLLDNFSRGLTRDGTLVGEYTSGIIGAFERMGLGDIVQRQVQQARTQLKSLDVQFEQLAAELREVKSTGQGSFDAIEQKMIENRKIAQQLTGQIENVEAQLRSTGDIGSKITSGIAQGFKNIKTQIAQVLIGYLSFQAAINGARRMISENADLTDTYEDLKRVLQATNDEFETIKDSIRDIDTRTSLKDLFDFAFIAAKAGVAKQEIAGVTEALNELYVVAGKQLGGSAEEAFENLVKLNTIFNDGAAVTGDNLKKIGNALIQLDNDGVASVQFMTDFAKRMSGVEGITKITIGSVLGLGAAFEENGVSAEVAGTAISKVLIQLYNDTAKYAEVAGIAEDEFKNLLNTNPGEALLKVANGLRGTGTLATEFADSFKELGTNAVRVQMAMGTLAAKTDYFQQKIQIANSALNDNAAIADAAAKKEENFAAIIARIRKSFEELATSKAALITLTAISSVILLIIQNLPTLITLVGLWALGWAAANKEMVLQYSRLLLVNGQLIISRILLGALTIAQTAYNAVISIFTGEITLATGATRIFGIALKSLPFGWIIAILGTVIALVVSLGHAFAGTTDSLKESARIAELNNQVMKKTSDQIGDTLASITSLTKAINNNNISLEARQLALKKLIAIAPDHLNALTLENINTKVGKELIDDYVSSLKEKIKYQVIESNLNKATADREQAIQNQQRAASDEEFAKEQYRKMSNTPFFNSVGDAIKYGTIHSEQAYMEEYYKAQQSAAEKDITFYQGQLDKSLEESAKKVSKTEQKVTDDTVGARIDYLKAAIKKLEDAYKTLNITDSKGQAANLAQRKKYQDELDKLQNNYRGSRLDGQIKDRIKEIDAATELEKTELEKRKLQGEISETNYWESLNNITQKGISQKLAILKNGTASEKNERAKLQLESIKSAQETADKIFEIDSKIAKQKLDESEANAQTDLDNSLKNIHASSIEKAQAQLEYDKKVLDAQTEFNNKMDILEKQRNEKSKDNAIARQNELKKINDKTYKDLVSLFEESINTTRDSETSGKLNADTEYLKEKSKIYDAEYNSEVQRNRALETLEQEHQAKILRIQQASLNSQLILLESMHTAGLISDEDYKKRSESIQNALADTQVKISKLNLDIQIKSWKDFQDFIKNLSADLQVVNQAVIQPLLDIQDQRIENEKKYTDEQLEQEKERMLNQATTQEEKDAIEAKYKKKQAAADKKYAEEKKQLALKQLAISSALAAVKALESLPNYYQVAANLALVGTEYILNRKKIMEQQFEKGGALKQVLNSGGVFSGPSHKNGGIKFLFSGQPKEVQGKEGYVINDKSMASNRNVTVSGTPAQIASAANVLGGGIDFAPGAKRMMFEYGGILGSNLTAPIYPSPVYYQSQTSTSNRDISDLKEMYIANMRAIESVSNQVLSLQVKLDPNKVTKYQNSRSKAVKLGTL